MQIKLYAGVLFNIIAIRLMQSVTPSDVWRGFRDAACVCARNSDLVMHLYLVNVYFNFYYVLLSFMDKFGNLRSIILVAAYKPSLGFF
jgi:hypothetical protein